MKNQTLRALLAALFLCLLAPLPAAAADGDLPVIVVAGGKGDADGLIDFRRCTALGQVPCGGKCCADGERCGDGKCHPRPSSDVKGVGSGAATPRSTR